MTFSGWESLGGTIKGPPSIQVWAGDDDHADSYAVFALGAIDNKIWKYSDGHWARLDNSPLTFASAPVVDNHLRFGGPLDIVAVASDQQVWVKPDGVTNSEATWVLLGGTITAESAIVSRQFVFSRAKGNRLWMHPWGKKWEQLDHHWTLDSGPTVGVLDLEVDVGYQWPLGGDEVHQVGWVLAVAVSATAPGAGIGSVWTKRYFSIEGTWEDGWEDRGKGFRCVGAPSIVCADQWFPIFACGLNRLLYSDWRQPDGHFHVVNDDMKLGSGPGVALGHGVMHIVVRGQDGGVYHGVWDGGS